MALEINTLNRGWRDWHIGLSFFSADLQPAFGNRGVEGTSSASPLCCKMQAPGSIPTGNDTSQVTLTSFIAPFMLGLGEQAGATNLQPARHVESSLSFLKGN